MCCLQRPQIWQIMTASKCPTRSFHSRQSWQLSEESIQHIHGGKNNARPNGSHATQLWATDFYEGRIGKEIVLWCLWQGIRKVALCTSLRLCLAVPSTEHVQPKFKVSKAIKSSHSATVPRKNKCFPDIRITKYPTKSKVGQLATMLQNRRTQRGANAKMKWFWSFVGLLWVWRGVERWNQRQTSFFTEAPVALQVSAFQIRNRSTSKLLLSGPVYFWPESKTLQQSEQVRHL